MSDKIRESLKSGVVKALQGALHDGGYYSFTDKTRDQNVDGHWGRDTARATMGYLQNEGITSEDALADNIRQKMDEYRVLDRALGLSSTKVEDLLEVEDELTKAEVKHLQTQLGLEDDGKWGTLTSDAVIRYLNQNPDQLGTISIHALETIGLKNKDLHDIAQNSEAFRARVWKHVDELKYADGPADGTIHTTKVLIGALGYDDINEFKEKCPKPDTSAQVKSDMNTQFAQAHNGAAAAPTEIAVESIVKPVDPGLG